jgi:AmiR/NasT family two-component response regulator
MATSRKATVRVDGSEMVFSAAATSADGSGRLVVVVGGRESELATRAAALGLESLLASGADLEQAIENALRAAAELHRLRTVAARLAQVERAKGILMERHQLSERDAHDRMRRHARSLNVRLTAVAEAVEDSYLLVPPED